MIIQIDDIKFQEWIDQGNLSLRLIGTYSDVSAAQHAIYIDYFNYGTGKKCSVSTFGYKLNNIDKYLQIVGIIGKEYDMVELPQIKKNIDDALLSYIKVKAFI